MFLQSLPTDYFVPDELNKDDIYLLEVTDPTGKFQFLEIILTATWGLLCDCSRMFSLES